jgi:hypothetical protein
MGKVELTVTVPNGLASWLGRVAGERDKSISRLLTEAWNEQAAALGAILPDSEERNAMHVAGLYLAGVEDLSKLTGDELSEFRELSLSLSEEAADAIDEEVDRLEIPADVLVAWVYEKALKPADEPAMFE